MDYFNQLGRFILLKKSEITNSNNLFEEYFDYNFLEYADLNYAIDPRTVKKLDTPVCFQFYHNKIQKNIIKNAVGLYENHTDGVARMVYSNNLQKLFRETKLVISPSISLVKK